jgi:LysR family transcriptional regulator for bpeEF and oprC
MQRLRQFELLVRAVEAGSFAKAAASLDLTPSALSHSIAELEKQLRVTLFYRTTRQLRLTEDGEELYRRAREIMDKVAEAETAVSRVAARISGTLRIGIPTAVSLHIIMPALPQFMRRHPDLKLEARLVKQVNEMHAGGFDLLLRVGEPPESGLIARRIARIKYGVYAAPEYLNFAGEPLTPEDLSRHRCLVFKPNWATRPLDEWHFERAGVRKSVRVPAALVTDDREGLIAAALAGGGVMRSGMFGPAAIATGRLKRLLGEWTCLDAPALYVLYRRTPRLAPHIAAFLEFAAQAFAAFDPEELTLIHGKSVGPASASGKVRP